MRAPAPSACAFKLLLPAGPAARVVVGIDVENTPRRGNSANNLSGTAGRTNKDDGPELPGASSSNADQFTPPLEEMKTRPPCDVKASPGWVG